MARARKAKPAAKSNKTTRSGPHSDGAVSCSSTQLALTNLLCVLVTPNPEFAISPYNYAHFLLAVVAPVVNALHARGLPPRQILRSRHALWHGHNRVFPKWKGRYAELLGAGARCNKTSQRHQAGEAEHDRWSLWANRSGCAVAANISIPAFTLTSRGYYANQAPWRTLSIAMRGSLLPVGMGRVQQRHVLVVLRGVARHRRIDGLERACGLSASAQLTTVCIERLDALPLTQVALELDGARGLLTGHGAALANLPFMRVGSRVAELDSIRNINKARNMYQYLAHALGLRVAKIWLNETGARFCPSRVSACKAGGGASTVHGCNIGYVHNTTLTRPVLRDVLRDVTAEVEDEHSMFQRPCGVDLDQARPHQWWRLNNEMTMLY